MPSALLLPFSRSKRALVHDRTPAAAAELAAVDSGLVGPDDIFCLSNLTLPRVQLLELEAALHGFQGQCVLVLPDLFFVHGRPPQ